MKKNQASGLPSLFSSGDTSNRNKIEGASYLQKRYGKVRGTGRPKVNILALVDGAIEDGATDEAKQKAFAERSTSKVPVPTIKKTMPASESRAKLQSPRLRSKSTERKPKQVQPILSVVRNSPGALKSQSPHTPAWKSRLNKQGKKMSDALQPEEKSSDKTDKKRTVTQPSPKSKGKSPKTGKRAVRRKSTGKTFPPELPLSRDEQAKGLPTSRIETSVNPFIKPNKIGEKEGVAARSKKEKKEKKKEKKEKKKEKKEKQNKATDPKISATKTGFGKVDYEDSENSFNDDDVIFTNTDRRDTKVASPGGDPIARLRKKIKETEMQLENFDRVSQQELADMEKEFVNTKESTRYRLMKDIHSQGKKNDVKYQEYKKVVDEKQKDIDDLRSANQRLRTTIQKIPKQMAEVIFLNHSLEEANEEVFSHIKGLEMFSKKLQTDQHRYIQSNDKCKNHYLPRYRQQLWKSGQHLESESKIKKHYRDCIIKITKKIETCRQVDLVEEISSMALETEGEVNPKFDPKFLSAKIFGSDDSSSSDSDDSDSSDSTSSSDS